MMKIPLLFNLTLAALLSTWSVTAQIGGTTASGLRLKTVYANEGANLYALKTAAAAGTTIVVGPGLYTLGVTNLLKHRVNWHFVGSVVSNGAQTVGGIFDNSGLGTVGAIESVISGTGTFYDGAQAGRTHRNAILNVSNTASRITFQARRLQSLSPSGATHSCLAVWEAALVQLDVDEFDGGLDGQCVYFKNGTVKGRVDDWRSDIAHTMFAEGNAPSLFDVSFKTMMNTGLVNILWRPTHAQARLFLTGDEIISSIVNAELGGVALDVTGGQVDVNVKRWSLHLPIGPGDETGSVIGQSGGTLRVKASTVATTNIHPFFQQSGGVSWLEVDEWIDQGPATPDPRPYGFWISGGTNYFLGGRVKTLGGPAFKLEGGQLHLEETTVDTFSTLRGSNVCLWITGGVPVIKDSVMIPGSHFSVSNASAGDLRIYGSLFAKSNITATLTARGGAVTVSTFVDR